MDKDSRGKLIEVATELFAQKGFYAVSIREIAQKAEVNSALISYHFGGKEGLYQSVLEEQFFYLMAMLDKIRDAEHEPKERLKFFMKNMVKTHREKSFLWPLVHGELINPTDCFDSVIKKFVEKVVIFVGEALMEGQGKKIFREDLHPAFATLALAGTLNFYFIAQPMVNKIMPPTKERDEKYLEHTIAIYFEGIERR